MLSNKQRTMAITTIIISMSVVFSFPVGLGNDFSTTKEAYAVHESLATADVWNYDIHWFWSSENHAMKGRLSPEIIINATIVQTEENTDIAIIEGAIVEPNDKRLTMYDKESVVLAKFGYDSGLSGKWYMAARPSDGTFTITVPDKYADADWIRIWVNGHDFSVLPASLEDYYPHKLDEEAVDEIPYFTTNNSINITLSEDRELFFIENTPTAIMLDNDDENDDNILYSGSYQTQIKVIVNSALGTFRLTH